MINKSASNIDELFEKSVFIGEGVRINNGGIFCGEFEIGNLDDPEEVANIKIDNQVAIGKNVTVKDTVTIGTSVTIGEYVDIGTYVTIGDSASIGGNIKILNDLTIETECRIVFEQNQIKFIAGDKTATLQLT